jgi:arabinofuranosyltransferase
MPCVVALATAWAWTNRFVQDDAFISFRYAQHIAGGQGFVWNVGERPLEGVTNLLWTLLLAGGFKLGIDPERASIFMGLGCFVGALFFTRALGRRVAGEEAALLAVVLVATNATYSAYATGGLETQLLALEVTAMATCVCAERPAARELAFASLVAGLSLWTRLDTGIFIAVLGVGFLASHRRVVADHRSLLVAIVAPLAVCASMLLVFKLRVFGRLLPNTFYAKVDPPNLRTWGTGAEYVLAFVRAYALFVPIGLVLAALAMKGPGSRRTPALLFACVATWTLYIVAVGGDFMEFRMFVPVLPIGAVLFAWALLRTVAVASARIAVAGFVVAASVAFVMETYDERVLQDGNAIETINGLRGHLSEAGDDWIGLGKTLGHDLGSDPDVTIAVGAAGTIPYFSGLRTIDMLGLTDASVARGPSTGIRTGHRRMAPLPYLKEQRVNLAFMGWAADDPDIPAGAS